MGLQAETERVGEVRRPGGSRKFMCKEGTHQKTASHMPAPMPHDIAQKVGLSFRLKPAPSTILHSASYMKKRTAAFPIVCIKNGAKPAYSPMMPSAATTDRPQATMFGWPPICSFVFSVSSGIVTQVSHAPATAPAAKERHPFLVSFFCSAGESATVRYGLLRSAQRDAMVDFARQSRGYVWLRARPVEEVLRA